MEAYTARRCGGKSLRRCRAGFCEALGVLDARLMGNWRELLQASEDGLH
jgi:hypothetical protein